MDKGLSLAEQEVSVSMMRTDEHAIVYASDTTFITKLDKLCVSSPEYYSLIEETNIGKTYKIKDKGLVSFRQKKREMTDEAKAAASMRFKALHAERKKNEQKTSEEKTE